MYDTFILDGLGEELCLTDILPVDKRQPPGADTNDCGALLRKHRDVDAVLLPHKKDFRRVEYEEFLEVRVDLGGRVKEHVREHEVV